MVNPVLTEMVRSTLEDLEAAMALPQDDPALSELTQSIVRSVAELAVKRDEHLRSHQTKQYLSLNTCIQAIETQPTLFS